MWMELVSATMDVVPGNPLTKMLRRDGRFSLSAACII
jgi:hypothetical protein